MSMLNKQPFTSKTILGILSTVAVAIAVPAWQGYREGGSLASAVDKALPALISIIPAGVGCYGRAVAKEPLIKTKENDPII